MSFPKVVSALHMMTLVGSFATSGWLEDPIGFYGEFYYPVFLEKPIPKASVEALEHVSIVLAEWYLLYAGFILLMAWKWGQTKSAMYLGLAFSTANFVSDVMLPKPIARTLVFWNIRLPLADPTPVVFGIMFLVAILISKESHPPHDKSKQQAPRVTQECKTWSLFYLNITALSVMATLWDPSVPYLYGSMHQSYATTPRSVQRVMVRVAFSVALLQSLMAVAICVQSHATRSSDHGSSASSLLYAPVLFELLHMLHVQLFYPWQPHATLLIPKMEQDANNHNVIIMPPFVTSVVILVGSVVALYAQQTMSDQNEDDGDDDDDDESDGEAEPETVAS